MFGGPACGERLRSFQTARKAIIGVLLAVCVGGMALAGCGATDLGGTSGGTVRVVAAEDFWGSIAAQVGGSHVSVTSIITDPNADPHSYEPTSQDARTVAEAQYVIVNGAGYDQWAENLLSGEPGRRAQGAERRRSRRQAGRRQSAPVVQPGLRHRRRQPHPRRLEGA